MGALTRVRSNRRAPQAHDVAVIPPVRMSDTPALDPGLIELEKVGLDFGPSTAERLDAEHPSRQHRRSAHDRRPSAIVFQIFSRTWWSSRAVLTPAGVTWNIRLARPPRCAR